MLSSGSDLSVLFNADGTVKAKKTFQFCGDEESKNVNISIIGSVEQIKGESC